MDCWLELKYYYSRYHTSAKSGLQVFLVFFFLVMV